MTARANAIDLGVSDISGYNAKANTYEHIYFGGNSYNVLAKDNVYDTSKSDKALFLLSTYCVNLPTALATNTQTRTWQGCNGQAWCSSYFDSSFTPVEKNSIAKTVKSEAAYEDDYSGIGWTTSALSGDQLFFLSPSEAENGTYGFYTDDANKDKGDANRKGYQTARGDTFAWWLRSFCSEPTFLEYGAVVPTTGTPGNYARLRNQLSPRPAFNLLQSAVVLSSAADNGKSATVVTQSTDTLPAVGSKTPTDWKVTLYNSSLSVKVDKVTRKGNVATITYSGLSTGTDQFLSAIILSKDGKTILNYGKLASAQSSSSGSVSFTIPDNFDSDDLSLKVFSETCRANRLSDYAGNLVSVNVPAPGVEILGTTSIICGNLTMLTARVTGGTIPFTYKWSSGQATATITVGPTDTTTYTCTVTDSKGRSNSDSATVTVIPATYDCHIIATTPKSGFADLAYGYTTGSTVTYTVRNDGNSTATGVTVRITDGGSSFEVVSPTSSQSLAPGATMDVTVRTKLGLHVAGSPYTGKLTVKWDQNTTGISTDLSQTVVKARRSDCPTTLSAENETVKGRSDGKIEGVTASGTTAAGLPAAMEWKPDDASSSWTAVTTEQETTGICNLAPGNYLIRYAESDNYLASTNNAAIVVAVGADPTYTLNITPQTATVPEVIEGYKTAPDAITFTVDDTGNSDVTGLSLTFDSATTAAFDVTTTFPDTLASGAETTFTLTPKTGLATGVYSWTATVTGTGGSGASAVTTTDTAQIDWTVIARTYDLAITGIDPQTGFEELTFGYFTGSSVTYTFQDKGNSPVTGLTTAITDGANSFAVSSGPSSTSLDPGESATVTVSSLWGLLPTSSPFAGILKIAAVENADGTTAQLSQTVVKAATGATPDALTKTDETVKGLYNGTISGVNDTMEYKLDSENGFHDVPTGATTLEHLVPGVYQIRYKENANFLAGPIAQIHIAVGADPTYTLLMYSTPSSGFADITYGYSSKGALTCTVTDVGNSPVTNVVIKLTDGNATFSIPAIPQQLAGGMLAPDESASFQITYPTGLSAGAYSCTVTLTSDQNTENTVMVFPLTVNKAPQLPPITPAGKAESVRDASDGMIVSVNDTMEYRASDDDSYTAIPKGATTLYGLAAGTYEIRYRETDNFLASPDMEVTVSAGPSKTQPIPSTDDASGLLFAIFATMAALAMVFIGLSRYLIGARMGQHSSRHV